MHDSRDKDAVVLKVSVSLETLSGERIAEVKTDRVFRDVFGVPVLGSAEGALLDLLETEVVVPCRALIRTHVEKLQEQADFTRLDRSTLSPSWVDRSITAAFLARLDGSKPETGGR